MIVFISYARKKKEVPATRNITSSHTSDSFSRGIMISVGASRIKKTGVVFVGGMWSKVNSEYYCDHDLKDERCFRIPERDVVVKTGHRGRTG